MVGPTAPLVPIGATQWLISKTRQLARFLGAPFARGAWVYLRSYTARGNTDRHWLSLDTAEARGSVPSARGRPSFNECGSVPGIHSSPLAVVRSPEQRMPASRALGEDVAPQAD